MIKFEISIPCFKKSKILEAQFWEFIDQNEICSVQADCNYDEDFKAWAISLVPNFNEDKKEFMQLCNAMIEEFENFGYEF